MDNPWTHIERLWRVLMTIALVVAAFVVAIFFITYWWWQQPISVEECAVLIRKGNTIARALDQFKQDRGTLPDNLKELTPTYITDISCPQTKWFSGSDWTYVRKTDEKYLLVKTALHFVSSYDALVYSSTGTVPSAWRTKAATYDYDGWYYFLGGSSIRELLEKE